MRQIYQSVFAIVMALSFLGANGLEAQQKKKDVAPSSEPHATVASVLQSYIDALGGEQRLRKVDAVWIEGKRIEEEEFRRDIYEESFASLGNDWVVTQKNEEQTKQIGARGRLVALRHSTSKHTWIEYVRLGHMFWYRNFYDRSFNRPLGWLSDTSGITFVGRKSIHGKAAWRLDFDGGAAGRISRYFDCDSGLLVKADFRTKPTLQTVVYGDYRMVDGIRVPHSITGSSDQPAREFSFKMDSVSFEKSSLPNPLEVPSVIDKGDGKVRFKGVVVSKATGKPIPNVAITIGYENHCVGMTDAEGRFCVTHKPSGDLKIISIGDFQFVAPESLMLVPAVVESDEWSDETPNEVRIEMEPGALFHGRISSSSTTEGVSSVLDTYISQTSETKASKVGGVRVATPTIRRHKTDPEGRFQMIVPDFDFDLKVRAESLMQYELVDLNWNRTARVRIESLDDTPLNLELNALSEVFVQVSNSNGTVAKQLHVYGDKPSRHGSGSKKASNYGVPRGFYVATGHPDFQAGPTPYSRGKLPGNFAVYGADKGSGRVLVILDGMNGEGAAVRIDEENFPAGALSKEVTLQPFATVVGRLCNVPAGPDHRVKVFSAIGGQGLSYSDLSKDNEFELRYVVPGFPINIRFSSREVTRDIQVTLKPGEELDLGDIDYEQLSQVLLTVVDEVTGDPIQGAGAYLGASTSPMDQKKSDVLGQLSFRTRELSTGPESPFHVMFEVRLDTSVSNSTHVTGRYIFDCGQADPGPLEMKVKLPRKRTIQGRVVNKLTGEPLGATVICWPPSGLKRRNWEQVGWAAETNAQGEFSVDVGVDRGQLEIRCSKPRQFQILQERTIQEMQRKVVNAYLEFDLKTIQKPVLVEVAPLRKDRLSVVLPNGEPAKQFCFLGMEPAIKDFPLQLLIQDKEMEKLTAKNPRPTYSDAVTVYGLKSSEARLLLAYLEKEGELFGAARIQKGKEGTAGTGEGELPAMRLQPCGSLTGTWKGSSKGTARITAWLSGSERYTMTNSVSFEVDEDNRFEIPGLVPGLDYRVQLSSSRQWREYDSSELGNRTRSRSIFVRQLVPGQTVDLGELEHYDENLLGF